MFRAVLAVSQVDAPGAQEVRGKAVQHVLDSQNDDGGWGQQPGSPSDPVSTAYAIITLCHQPDPRPVAAAVAYLRPGRTAKEASTPSPTRSGRARSSSGSPSSATSSPSWPSATSPNARHRAARPDSDLELDTPSDTVAGRNLPTTAFGRPDETADVAS